MKNHNWHCYIITITLYIPLITIPTLTLTAGKELRPSYHGLTNDTAESPETAASPQMSSFFGGGASSETTQPLPEARNFSGDPSWNNGGSNDHARKVLIVSGLVCGTAGVALLAVVGFMFLHRYRNQRSMTVVSS